MEIKRDVEPSDYPIGIIVARFQVHLLHESHIELLNDVCSNHKKVVLFLGVSNSASDESDPMDFATRKIMVQELYPNIVILPLQDRRDDYIWSAELDRQISLTFGNNKALLYGSRDSFIPHYFGKHRCVELVTTTFYSGTEVRKEVSREILGSSDFRAGVIYSHFGQYPVAFPTVDIACLNSNGEVLLAMKPDEKKWRFIGGYVDPRDPSMEVAARREFLEETGGCEIGDLTYVSSHKINDWRYRKSKNGIITTLFMGNFTYGSIKPSDDIEKLSWQKIESFKNIDYLDNNIMEEHVPLMMSLLGKLK
jgi:bifunctional NMN adenylyltransferase/nudix hydrolase